MTERDAHVITLTSPSFDERHVHVGELSGHETIGELFSFRVRVLTPRDQPLDLDAVQGETIAIVFRRKGELVHRRWGMVIEVVDDLGLDTDYRSYWLRIEPRAHRLALVHTQDILMGLSWPDAIKEKLTRVALGDATELRTFADYATREFIVQYDETDLAFVSRIAEHVGISFFFEHDDEQDRIVFADSNEGFSRLDEPVSFDVGMEHAIYSLAMRSRILPAQVAVQDYNYRTPTVDLTAFAEVEGGYGGGVAEFGLHYKTPEQGATMARLRAEELRAHQRLYTGKSLRPELSAGLRISVTDHPDLADPELLVTSVHHESRQSALGHGADEQFYRNTFEAIPADRPFRPKRKTPRPRMVGFFTGLVQPSDEELIGPSAELDDDGRYRVRMCFDIKPRKGNVSRPVRMAQPHSGAGHGMHFPLRPGVEVAIVFANGDPDRPIIVGALDNPATPSPTVGKNSKQNIISTATGIKITLRDSH